MIYVVFMTSNENFLGHYRKTRSGGQDVLRCGHQILDKVSPRKRGRKKEILPRCLRAKWIFILRAARRCSKQAGERIVDGHAAFAGVAHAAV